MVAYVVAIVLIAFIFDFINGFHDSANSIATIVGTRVLSPLAAVVWAAVFNFAAAFTGSLAVAKAIGGGMIEQSIVKPNVILGGLLGAITWNLITWCFGIPSSSSHALIGGYAGAAMARAGLAAITWGTKWVQTLSFIVISPLVGLLAGYIADGDRVLAVPPNVGGARRSILSAGAARSAPRCCRTRTAATTRRRRWASSSDCSCRRRRCSRTQTGLLHHFYLADNKTIPHWVEICAYTAISLGTLFGGWRIVYTMGSRITKLRPVGGFCAETGGAAAILIATHFGIPVSTTHTITGSIVGVGATQRLSAVRWGIAGRIVWAWVLTIPAAGIMAAISYHVLALIVHF